MARPERNNVDYFPFYCEDGNKMFYLEETYGNDGFAVFLKILRELAKTNYHYLDLSKQSTMMFLSAKCKVSKEVLQLIISDLVDLGKFNSELWKDNKIIWCQDFIDSIQDAYIKRKNKCITLHGLYLLLVSLGIRKHGLIPLKGTVNTQRKEKEIKQEEIKEKEIKLEIFEIDNYSFLKESLISEQWIEVIASQSKITIDGVKFFLNNFDQHLITYGEQKECLKEYKKHFSNWIKKQNTSMFGNGFIGKTNQI